jgi:hypothetical protein
MKIDTTKGKCKDCADAEECPMTEMLETHKTNQKLYGEDYKYSRPDLWDEESTEEPEFEDGEIVWCPMFFKKEGAQ